MEKRKINKLGLALGGGGARGSYHIGIFKSLQENGLIDKIKAVSGASAGSLNAPLFVQNNLSVATYIWLCEVEKEILYFDEKQFKQGFKFFSNLFHLTMGQNDWHSLIEQSKQNAIFSRKGLSQIIDTYIQIDTLKQRNINIYVSCTQVKPQIATYFNLTQLATKEEMIKVLLASSAIPAVFGKEKIGDQLYMDGGMADNLPIQPLYDEGCDLIITAPLWKDDRVNQALYPNCQFIELVPDTDLGGIPGVFDFSPKSCRDRINQAYEEQNTLLSILPDIFQFD